MSLQKSLAKVQKWKKDLTPQTKLARRAWCTIGYQHWGSKESKDITDDISKYLLDVTFTDNLSGTVDDVAISLEDRGRLCAPNQYLPPKLRVFIDYLVACLAQEPQLKRLA